jgi:hypothetical protein
MTEAAKTSILEKLHPSKHTKEAVAAGLMYIPGKTAAQFFGTVEKTQAERLKTATENIEKAKTEHPEIIDLINALTPLLADDLDKAVKQLDQAMIYLRYAATILKHEKYVESLKFCRDMEENHTSKFGLDEMSRRFIESDILLAAAMSEDNDR